MKCLFILNFQCLPVEGIKIISSNWWNLETARTAHVRKWRDKLSTSPCRQHKFLWSTILYIVDIHYSPERITLQKWREVLFPELFMRIFNPGKLFFYPICLLASCYVAFFFTSTYLIFYVSVYCYQKEQLNN